MNRILTSLLSATVGLAVLAIGAAPATAVDDLKLALNFFPYGVHAGFIVAKAQGFYRDAGLNVEILKGEGSADAVRKVGAGLAPIGVSDVGTMILGRTRGLKLKTVAIILDRDPSAIFALKTAGVKTPKDLEGKSVGAASAVALRDLWPALARANGVDMSRVTWIDMPGPAYVASLMSHRVDAIATFLTTMPVFQAQAKKQGDEVTVLSYADFGVDTYGFGIFATEDAIRTQPDLVRRFTHASLQGYAWSFEHPDEAVAAFLREYPELDPARVREEMRITSTLMLTPHAAKYGIGTLDGAKVKRTRDLILAPRGTDPATIPISDIYTSAFLPKLFAKSKF